MNKVTAISLNDVKSALRDSKFREKIPESCQIEVQKYLQNPNCTCNIPIYTKILKECKELLKEYFPNKIHVDPDVELQKLSKNNWTVINCSIGELESYLKRLGHGRKQIAVARYQDQITVIVNEIDHIY